MAGKYRRTYELLPENIKIIGYIPLSYYSNFLKTLKEKWYQISLTRVSVPNKLGIIYVNLVSLFYQLGHLDLLKNIIKTQSFRNINGVSGEEIKEKLVAFIGFFRKYVKFTDFSRRLADKIRETFNGWGYIDDWKSLENLLGVSNKNMKRAFVTISESNLEFYRKILNNVTNLEDPRKFIVYLFSALMLRDETFFGRIKIAAYLSDFSKFLQAIGALKDNSSSFKSFYESLKGSRENILNYIRNKIVMYAKRKGVFLSGDLEKICEELDKNSELGEYVRSLILRNFTRWRKLLLMLGFGVILKKDGIPKEIYSEFNVLEIGDYIIVRPKDDFNTWKFYESLKNVLKDKKEKVWVGMSIRYLLENIINPEGGGSEHGKSKGHRN